VNRLWHLLGHPVLAALVLGLAGGAVLLAARGRAPAKAALRTATPGPPPSVLAGLALYDELGCAWCHSIQGVGGKKGRDLWRIGARRSREWLGRFLPDPAGLLPGAAMPPVQLPPAELAALVAYLASLDLTDRPALPAAPEVVYGARDLVRAGCLACHRIGPEGAGPGPDLTRVGAGRGREAIARTFGAASSHPPLGEGKSLASLDEGSRARMVAYLSTLR
jgi:mono/diheme cytochrome c family protein